MHIPVKPAFFSLCFTPGYLLMTCPLVNLLFFIVYAVFNFSKILISTICVFQVENLHFFIFIVDNYSLVKFSILPSIVLNKLITVILKLYLITLISVSSVSLFSSLLFLGFVQLVLSLGMSGNSLIECQVLYWKS